MSAPVDLVLSKLDGVERRGDRTMARCPAHDDRTPSLSVAEGDDGRALLHCFAGCPTSQVVIALGLAMPDLFVERKSSTSWLREHRYRRADGEVIYRVRRGVRKNGDKHWTMQRCTPTAWVTGMGKGDDKVDRVLYGLPELLASPDLPVWITEGERDADTLLKQGLLATTVAHNSWTGVDTSTLRGRDVVVVVDHDQAGWRRGADACEAATAAGARVTRVLRPADGHKDVTEHIAAGQTVDMLWPVDLAHDETPPPPPNPEVDVSRPAFRENGLALFNSVPGPVFLGLLQDKKIDHTALWVWLVLEERAGDTGIAHLKISEISKLIRRDPKLVRKALNDLGEVGLVARAKENSTARWRVHNPTRPGRLGQVDTGITFSSRSSRGTPSPSSSSTSPNTSPGTREELPSSQGAGGEEIPSSEDRMREEIPASEFGSGEWVEDPRTGAPEFVPF